MIRRNRRTIFCILFVLFVFIAALAGLFTFIGSRSIATAVVAGIGFGVLVDLAAWHSAPYSAIRRTRAEPAAPEDARKLRDLVEGLCIAIGMPVPRIYLIEDPSPNACAFGRGRKNSGIAVTRGLLDVMSRRELEGVIAHELAHINCSDVTVTTLSVTTLGGFAAVADSAADMYAALDGSVVGRVFVLPFVILTWPLKVCAMFVSFLVSRHRAELADECAIAIVPPTGLRSALEKLESDRTYLAHESRTTAQLWFVAPLSGHNNDRIAATNSWFDTHPPIAERIAALRYMEHLDPNGRGPVDATSTGTPVALDELAIARERMERGPRVVRHRASNPYRKPPVGRPPGWVHVDEVTQRYWQGTAWSNLTKKWDGSRWVNTSVSDDAADARR